MSETIAVLVTVTGDRGSLDDWVDPERPLESLLPAWASACSSAGPDELVIMAADGRYLYDLAETISGMGLAPGAALRLARVEEAAQLLEATDLPPAPPPVPPTPAPGSTTPDRPLTGVAPTATVAAPTQPGPTETGLASTPASSPSKPAPAPSTPAPASAPPVPAPDPWDAASLAPPPSRPSEESGQRGAPPVPASLPSQQSRFSRFGAALGAAASRRSYTDQPAAPFARAATLSAGERFRRSWRASDRVHALEALVRSAPLRRCLLVAVVSPKGGVGKTTITALTGMLLAELRRDPVLAVDANPDYGNLRDKLASQGDAPAPAVDELAAWLAEHPGATPTEVAARLGAGPHGLRYVPTPWTDPGRMVQVSADFDLYQNLLYRLRSYEGLILVDCGTGLLDPPVRAAIEAADQILLVTDSAPDSAGLVVAAADLLPSDTPTWLVANKMPAKGSELDLEKVAAAIPRLGGVTVVPEVRLAENVVTAGFRWEECPPAWRAPIREVAARLALDWPLRQ